MSNSNITSVLSYLKYVDELKTRLNVTENDFISFRSHAKQSYKLLPSLFRDDRVKSRESEALRTIEIVHPRELSGMSTLDKLVMLQHYEFPTRLLDFSFNPLVALFFASNAHSDCDGTVIMCKVSNSEIHQFDSNEAQGLAGLAICSNELKEKLSQCDRLALMRALNQFPNRRGFVNMYMDKQCDGYISTLARDFIRLLPEGVSGELDLFTPIFVKTKLLNPRIIAQKGAFLLFGFDEEFPKHIQRYEIPIVGEYKAKLIADLENFGIDESIMFPEFEHFLSYLRRKMQN